VKNNKEWKLVQATSLPEEGKKVTQKDGEENRKIPAIFWKIRSKRKGVDKKSFGGGDDTRGK